MSSLWRSSIGEIRIFAMSDTPKDQKAKELKIETEPGTAGDIKFQKVVQTFLKTPPRQHKEDAGKGAKPKLAKRKSG